MAYSRYYRYGYGRRYGYRRKARSVRAITTSRNFKASAANMTQNGLFSINVRNEIQGNIAQNLRYGTSLLDVPAIISQSPMHLQLSNVFDQYKIEKVSIKFRPIYNSDAIPASAYGAQTFFTCIDRSGFSANVDLAQLQTYQSYKESNWSLTGETNMPHYVNIGQTDVVGKSTYFDSKNTSTFPKVAYGVILPQPVSEAQLFKYSVEIDAQVRYRGVRLDTSSVSTRVDSLNF